MNDEIFMNACLKEEMCIRDRTGVIQDISLEVALQYNESYNASIYSFVNNITTPEGGTHEDGVRRALTRILNKYAQNNNLLKDKDDSLTGDDVKEGDVYKRQK